MRYQKWARRDSNPKLNAVQPLTGCEPLIYTSGERLRNGVEKAMMPITACLPLPPVTWGLRTRCEQRCERYLRIVPPGLLGFTVARNGQVKRSIFLTDANAHHHPHCIA
jgi:hypothetical protein